MALVVYNDGEEEYFNNLDQCRYSHRYDDAIDLKINCNLKVLETNHSTYIVHCQWSGKLVNLILPLKLYYLDLDHNSLTKLPDLPSTLRTLSCSNNYLKYLPDLPPKLNSLSCYNNELHSLPNLSSTLSYLNCRMNKIIKIPNISLLFNGYTYCCIYPRMKMRKYMKILHQNRHYTQKLQDYYYFIAEIRFS